MGRYTTLDEEVRRFKKMALITEGEISAKEPCGCNEPEDEDKNKEVITGEEAKEKVRGKDLDEMVNKINETFDNQLKSAI